MALFGAMLGARDKRVSTNAEPDQAQRSNGGWIRRSSRPLVRNAGRQTWETYLQKDNAETEPSECLLADVCPALTNSRSWSHS